MRRIERAVCLTCLENTDGADNRGCRVAKNQWNRFFSHASLAQDCMGYSIRVLVQRSVCPVRSAIVNRGPMSIAPDDILKPLNNGALHFFPFEDSRARVDLGFVIFDSIRHEIFHAPASLSKIP
jgi:hypothetical protein